MTQKLFSSEDYVVACPRCERKRAIETTRSGDGWVIICTHCGFEVEEEEDQQEKLR